MKACSLFYLMLAAFVFSTVDVSAQGEFETEKELMESVLGKAKKDFVSEFVDVDSDKSDVFWTYYNAYEEARKTQDRTRLRLLSTYIANYEQQNMGPRAMDKLSKQAQKLTLESYKLVDKYYKKILQKVGARSAVQFRIVESYIRAKVDSELYENLPL